MASLPDAPPPVVAPSADALTTDALTADSSVAAEGEITPAATPAIEGVPPAASSPPTSTAISEPAHRKARPAEVASRRWADEAPNDGGFASQARATTAARRCEQPPALPLGHQLVPRRLRLRQACPRPPRDPRGAPGHGAGPGSLRHARHACPNAGGCGGAYPPRHPRSPALSRGEEGFARRS